jgi:type II secretory pathway pseudopilin PulG
MCVSYDNEKETSRGGVLKMKIQPRKIMVNLIVIIRFSRWQLWNTCLFTLVELLVVIATISILLSMLLPALKMAKDVANKSVCANNLKQLGYGMYSYLDNNNGWFPTADIAGTNPVPNPRFWFNLIDYQLTNKDDSINSNNLLKTKRGVWLCPSNSYDDIGSWSYSGLSYGYADLGSYDRNGVVHAGGQKVRVSQVRRPSGLIMLGDSDGDKYYDFYIRSSGFTVGNRHQKGANVIFTDQHVERRLQKELMNPGVYRGSTPERWIGGTFTEEMKRLFGSDGYYAK